MSNIKNRLDAIEASMKLINFEYLGKVISMIEEMEKKHKELNNLRYILMKMIKNQDVSNVVKYIESNGKDSEICCVECGSKNEIHWHHVIPRSKGGNFTIPVCNKCHGIIHNDNPDKFVNHSALIRLGIEKAKAAGKKPGRPRTVSQEKIDLINKYRSEGMSIRAIAKATGVSKTSVLKQVSAVNI